MALSKIEICEVGPRDGLQSEPRIWSVDEPWTRPRWMTHSPRWPHVKNAMKPLGFRTVEIHPLLQTSSPLL